MKLPNMRLSYIALLVLISLVFNSHVHSKVNIPRISKTIFQFMRNKAENLIDTAGGNTQCAKDLKTLINDLVYMKKWALEMMDANAKISSGIMAGNYFMFGHYDQCVNIREIKNASEINGQYCTVFLTPSSKFSSEYNFFMDSVALSNYMGVKTNQHTAKNLKNIKMTFGLCIPHSCSIGNLQVLWDYIEHTFRVPVHVAFVDVLCRSRQRDVEPYDVDKYIIAFFTLYIFILLLSTCYDLVIHQHIEGKPESILVAFSLYTNTKKIFSYSEKSEKDGYMEAVNGIKVLSMLWVILGHRILLNSLSGITNGAYFLEWRKEVGTTFILASFFAVDTFFVLSGLLLSYGFLRYKSSLGKGKKTPFIKLYLLRLIRLYPALLATILFYISVMKKLGDGPVWPLMAKKVAGSCLHTWWASVFFMTNFINASHTCVEQSWFLTVDSHLFFISPIILMGLQKRPGRTCVACLGLCLASAIYTFIITIRNEYGTNIFEVNGPYQKYIYQSTFVRMPPWLIGIVFGFVIFKHQHIRIPKVTCLFVWVLTTCSMICLILVHLVFTRYEYDSLRAAIFNSCARSAWSLAIGSVVFLCTTGHGGFVNKFLSLPIFQVLVKISYSVYLVHLAVLLYFIGRKKHADHFSNIKNVHDFMGDLFFVFVAGVLCCLSFESPFIAISKILIRKEVEMEKLGKSKKRRRRKRVVCVYSYEKEFELSTKKCD